LGVVFPLLSGVVILTIPAIQHPAQYGGFVVKFKALNFELCFENNELQNGKSLKYQKLTLDFRKVNFPI
jgi:hypothetical protein